MFPKASLLFCPRVMSRSQQLFMEASTWWLPLITHFLWFPPISLAAIVPKLWHGLSAGGVNWTLVIDANDCLLASRPKSKCWWLCWRPKSSYSGGFNGPYASICICLSVSWLSSYSDCWSRAWSALIDELYRCVWIKSELSMLPLGQINRFSVWTR